MGTFIVAMAGVLFAVGLFCAGCWCGFNFKVAQPDGRTAAKPKTAEAKLEQLEQEAAMDNFFRYDGSEQNSPRDVAIKKMGENKR